MIEGIVKGQTLRLISPLIASDTVDYLEAEFVFRQRDWDGLSVIKAVFASGETAHAIPLTDGRIRREDHLNLTAGTWTVHLVGSEYVDGRLVQRITTAPDTLTVVPCGAMDGEPLPEMPATDAERLEARVEVVEQKLASGGGGGTGTDKYVESYRIVSNEEKNTHTLVLIYNDKTELSISLPQMGIDINRVVQFGVVDPDGNTPGETKQLYVNTNTGRMWVCKSGTVRPVNWIPIAGGGAVNVDKTLTVSGAAADAAVVGKKLAEQSEAKADKVLYSPNGTAWTISISDTGVITATKYSTGGEEVIPTVLETYTIFVPENVSDEWKVTGNYGELDMSTAEFLELFYDGFVSAMPGGVTVTKNSIGKDESGLYDMWEYDFCPSNYSRTILLSSGMHSYELSASFGLANFIGHLYTDTGNDAFSYIRNNVRVKVIPVVNPWGFNQYPKKYGNVNGVNPNRNFDYNGGWAAFPVHSANPNDNNYNEWNVKGNRPFAEAETINLAKWVLDNWDAEFWIDCHTGEGQGDKDLWIYYMSDSEILDRINGAITKIEEWFQNTYGSKCVTVRTIDSAGSIRHNWSNKCCGVQTFTLEQAPARTTYGTSALNEAADISNYSTNISTFVQEFLLEKYRTDTDIPITGVKNPVNIVLGTDATSATIEATISPADTTQNKFTWTSSNEDVCRVYGCTNKAVAVRIAAGKATLTGVNLYNASKVTTCDVTCNPLTFAITYNMENVTTSNAAETAIEGSAYTATLSISGEYNAMVVSVTMGGVDVTDIVYDGGVINIPSVSGNVVITANAVNNQNTITASICGVSSATPFGTVIENNARMTTDLIPVTGGTKISAESLNGYYIKIFEYSMGGAGFIKNSFIGDLTKVSISGNLYSTCTHIRVVFKKPDNSTFTADELTASTLKINDISYPLADGDITASIPDVSTEVTDSDNIVCEIGGINADYGNNIEAKNRLRSDYIAVDGTQATLGIVFTGLPDWCSFGCRFYESDKSYLGRNGDTRYWSVGTEINNFLLCGNGWLSLTNLNYAEIRYMRMFLVAPDAGDIYISDFENAAVIIDGHEYKFTFME